MYKTEDELEQMYQQYVNGTLQPTKKEKKIINPKIAYEVLDEDIVKTIPFKDIENNKHIYGTINKFSKISPVSNLLWDYLFFVNIDVFRPAALAFEESRRNCAGTIRKPSYTHHIKNTTAYKQFWSEEFKRIKHGYEPIIDGKPCGVTIPGEFYFYLNYGWINRVEFDKETGEPVRDDSGFPSFLSMDYYYFKELDARENYEKYNLPRSYKQSLVVAKARRLGFSYKAATGAVYKTLFKRNSKVNIASAEGVDAALCFKKAIMLIDHLSEYTPFGLEELGNPRQNGGWVHAKRSVKETEGKIDFSIISTKNNSKHPKSRNSGIVTTSLFNKSDAIAGEGLTRLYFEEAGKITNLESAWNFAAPAMKVGKFYRDGIAIIFGTGGEMVATSGKDGHSKAFSNLFYSPEPNGLAEYDNIYDYHNDGRKCGLFMPAMWFTPDSQIMLNGHSYKTIDGNGNAFFWVAELSINRERINRLPPKQSKEKYEEFLTQICKTPSEAFMITHTSVFQTEDLMRRQNEIIIHKGGFHKYRIAGELVEVNNEIRFEPNPGLEPITMSNINDSNKEGCLLQYEPPLLIDGSIPDNEYIISCDAIRNNEQGPSRIAIIVYKLSDERIVATYYGRKRENPLNHMHRLLIKLSKYYNAKITYENDADGGIEDYFVKHNQLHRLLPEPSALLDKMIANRKSRRRYGHPMSSKKHKDMGISYIYEWLDKRDNKTVHYDDEEGNKIIKEGLRNVDKLKDELLIEQLINFSRDGNFDAVSAFMGIMFQSKELEDNAHLSSGRKSINQQIKDLYENVFGYKS